MSIATKVRRLLKLPNRLQNVGSGYTISLMQDHGRRTLAAASDSSGLDPSQFSRFLANKKDLGLENLNRLIRRRLDRTLSKRRALVKGAPWRVAIIIDASLHERSSRHIDNAQRFNHGDGWVIGHQWTNIILVINETVIPLPPIAFLTEKKCKELKEEYKTEPERIMEYLSNVNWQELLPGVKPEEIVVLSDSGYDNKKLQRFFISQGWDFVGSIKKSRSVKTLTQYWQSVSDLFGRTRKIGPWQTVRHQAGGGKKRRESRIRTLVGYLKGVNHEVRLVSAIKPNGERLFLACSRTKIEPGAITRAYRSRWRVEIFHRDVKSYLGLEDAGLEKFDAIHAHVLWVYCVYLLLYELTGEASGSILARRRQVERLLRDEEIGEILSINARFDSVQAVRRHCLEVRQKLKVA
ncbi:MAG: transposase [Bdellovibrionales bacterium]|nr:transposase [Bdellovibrionales bacterium]